MKLALFVLATFSLSQLWRETNSYAASARGHRAYEKGDYESAAKAFARAQELAPSARNAFNLGTAQIAAGQSEQGSVSLTAALKDPSIRADALFNRGNSALSAKAFDHAIADYTQVLRLRPSDKAAKRNLEIALTRRRAEQQASASGKQQNQSGNNQQQQQQQQQSPSQNRQQQQPDLEALLRSVQQQEQEELRRMKGRSIDGRIGW